MISEFTLLLPDPPDPRMALDVLRPCREGVASESLAGGEARRRCRRRVLMSGVKLPGAVSSRFCFVCSSHATQMKPQ